MEELNGHFGQSNRSDINVDPDQDPDPELKLTVPVKEKLVQWHKMPYMIQLLISWPCFLLLPLPQHWPLGCSSPSRRILLWALDSNSFFHLECFPSLFTANSVIFFKSQLSNYISIRPNLNTIQSNKFSIISFVLLHTTSIFYSIFHLLTSYVIYLYVYCSLSFPTNMRVLLTWNLCPMRYSKSMEQSLPCSSRHWTIIWQMKE